MVELLGRVGHVLAQAGRREVELGREMGTGGSIGLRLREQGARVLDDRFDDRRAHVSRYGRAARHFWWDGRTRARRRSVGGTEVGDVDCGAAPSVSVYRANARTTARSTRSMYFVPSADWSITQPRNRLPLVTPLARHCDS